MWLIFMGLASIGTKYPANIDHAINPDDIAICHPSLP
jgi:hypothetical protein